MSRGLGKVERAALSFFEDNPSELLSSIDVTFKIHGDGCGRSQYSSTRRALNSLQKKGLVTRVEGSWRFGRSYYALPEKAEDYLRREREDIARYRLMYG